MTFKHFAAAFVLMMVPTLATAECGWSMGHEATMTCADGTTWDAQSGTCVPTATS